DPVLQVEDDGVGPARVGLGDPRLVIGGDEQHRAPSAAHRTATFADMQVNPSASETQRTSPSSVRPWLRVMGAPSNAGRMARKLKLFTAAPGRPRRKWSISRVAR